MPRRKSGMLVPLETEILAVALEARRTGQTTVHGFGLAQAIRESRGARALTGHGTLYKALGRLEELGLLRSRWEDVPATETRPRRRLYELTGQGVRVAEHAVPDAAGTTTAALPSVAPRPA